MTAPIITGLYVPGNRPDRFDKAVASGAQLVIIDLEDAVPAAEKADARAAVVDWLQRQVAPLNGQVQEIQVRVNQGDDDDLAALRPFAEGVTVRVPKVEHAPDLDRLEGFPRVAALLESALGVEHAFEIATHPLVSSMSLGDSDLASDLGSRSPQVLDYARIRLVFAARAAGLVAPMLSAWPGIRDLDGLRADTVRGSELGMVGRVAIHPSQLPVIATAFRPSGADVRWAEEVVAALGAGGVTTLSSGDMVDAAMAGQAERIIGLATATRAAGE